MRTPRILITIGYRNDLTPYAQALPHAGGDPVIAYARDTDFAVADDIAGVVLCDATSAEPQR